MELVRNSYTCIYLCCKTTPPGTYPMLRHTHIAPMFDMVALKIRDSRVTFLVSFGFPVASSIIRLKSIASLQTLALSPGRDDYWRGGRSPAYCWWSMWELDLGFGVVVLPFAYENTISSISPVGLKGHLSPDNA